MDFDPNLPPITAALAALMERDGRTPAEIARAAGMNRSNLARYLDGSREPRSHNLAAIELGMGLEYGTTYALAAKIAKGRKRIVRVNYAA